MDMLDKKMILEWDSAAQMAYNLKFINCVILEFSIQYFQTNVE